MRIASEPDKRGVIFRRIAAAVSGIFRYLLRLSEFVKAYFSGFAEAVVCSRAHLFNRL